MVEFCLACWNQLNDRQDGPERYVLSREPDLCEGCGQREPVIVRERLFWRPKKPPRVRR